MYQQRVHNIVEIEHGKPSTMSILYALTSYAHEKL